MLCLTFKKPLGSHKSCKQPSLERKKAIGYKGDLQNSLWGIQKAIMQIFKLETTYLADG
jgi:hypothetical protein